MQYKIGERFQIADRGLAVTTGALTDLPVGKAIAATVIRPDGSELPVTAHKEWLLRKSIEPLEDEAFLLVGIIKTEVPEGSTIVFHDPASVDAEGDTH